MGGVMPQCDCCGRFHNAQPGSAWKMVYSGHPPTPDREITRCKRCVDLYGPFTPQSGIKPEASCGMMTKQPDTGESDHRMRQVVQRLRLIEARVCDTDPCTARELRDIIEGMRG